MSPDYWRTRAEEVRRLAELIDDDFIGEMNGFAPQRAESDAPPAA